MAMVTYNVEVVGTNVSQNITDMGKFERYVQKLLGVIGASAQRHIRERIDENEWKRAPVMLRRATRYKVEPWAVEIFMDENIAPHAIYQEEGVRRHEMRYLLNATRPIPIGLGRGRKAVTLFRWATERWIGIPHTYVDPFSGMVREATGWVHPGYPGKYFFQRGIQDTMTEAAERARGLVFRVARGEL